MGMACEICTDIVGVKQGFPRLEIRIARGIAIIPDRVVVDDKCPCHIIVKLVPEPRFLVLCKGKGCMRVISIGIIRVRGMEDNEPDTGTVKGIVQGIVKRVPVLVGICGRAVTTGNIVIFMVSDIGIDGIICQHPVAIVKKVVLIGSRLIVIFLSRKYFPTNRQLIRTGK
jgi:hypothetical protein